MTLLQIYLIGMAIAGILIIIAANGEDIFFKGELAINIVMVFFALILWPVFIILIIIIMKNIYKVE